MAVRLRDIPGVTQHGAALAAVAEALAWLEASPGADGRLAAGGVQVRLPNAVAVAVLEAEAARLEGVLKGMGVLA
jgi:hypothetical protein